MDIYDPGLMGAAGRVGTSTPSTNEADQPAKTELDQNVEKLVGNISSWWSGIAKKSQDSLAQARKEVETRGGIVNFAKAEYAKLETSIGEAQKKARDQSQAAPTASDLEGEQTSESVAQSETSKGKQRAMDETTFEVQEGAQGQGPTLGASISTLFGKLTADPRLVSLQQSLTSTLQGVTSPKDGEPGQKNLQESLSKLSATIQSHLPHLDLKESQQLATRYLHATENFAREMQSDMKELVGDLVRIVPPEEDESASAAVEASKETAVEAPVPQASPKPADSKITDVAAPAHDEEDFAWDEDDEEAAAGADSKSAPAAPEPKPEPASAEPAKTPTKPSEPHQSDEDSDWE
ncbi:hypothetical protein PaG_04907 [Moesziomyces aphidis]|jgi:hypothetical protein|uniref:BSD domain-containing protein n=1 Tax=Moesziomyces aphidis TaxID=84754 RepID=W3VJP0_MOEAP|nr:hypothetical protein PaG_04907 [Moesziomyces aphidis]